MTLKMLPCPWCNLAYQGHWQTAGGAWLMYTVPSRHADNCPLRDGHYATEADLTAAWNTRAFTPDATQTLEGEKEQFAKIAECAFDDRPRSRVGHPSQMDWEDGYRDGTSAAAAAIRAAIESTSTRQSLDGLCAWLLHRFGPDSPEGREASCRLATTPARNTSQIGEGA